VLDLHGIFNVMSIKNKDGPVFDVHLKIVLWGLKQFYMTTDVMR